MEKNTADVECAAEDIEVLAAGQVDILGAAFDPSLVFMEEVPVLGLPIPSDTATYQSDLESLYSALSRYTETIYLIEEGLSKGKYGPATPELQNVVRDWQSFNDTITSEVSKYAATVSTDPQAMELTRFAETNKTRRLRAAWLLQFMPRIDVALRQASSPAITYYAFLHDEDAELQGAAQDIEALYEKYLRSGSTMTRQEGEKLTRLIGRFQALLQKKKGDAAVLLASMNAVRGLTQAAMVTENVVPDAWLTYQPVPREEIATVIESWRTMMQEFSSDYEGERYDEFLLKQINAQPQRGYHALHGLASKHRHPFGLKVAAIANQIDENGRIPSSLFLVSVSTANHLAPYLGRSLVYVAPPGVLENQHLAEMARNTWMQFDLPPTAHDAILLLSSSNKDEGKVAYAFVLKMQGSEGAQARLFYYTEAGSRLGKWYTKDCLKTLLYGKSVMESSGAEASQVAILDSAEATAVTEATMKTAVDKAFTDFTKASCTSREQMLLAAYLYAAEMDETHADNLSAAVRVMEQSLARTALFELILNGSALPKMTLVGRLLTVSPAVETVFQRACDPGVVLNYIAEMDDSQPALYRQDAATLLGSVKADIHAAESMGTKSDCGVEAIDALDGRMLAADIAWGPNPLLYYASTSASRPRNVWLNSHNLTYTDEILYSTPRLTTPAGKVFEFMSPHLAITVASPGTVTLADFVNYLGDSSDADTDGQLAVMHATAVLEGVDNPTGKELTAHPPTRWTAVFADPTEAMFNSMIGLFCGVASSRVTTLPEPHAVKQRVFDVRCSKSMATTEGMFPFASFLPPCPGKIQGEVPRFMDGDVMALASKKQLMSAASIAEQYKRYVMRIMAWTLSPEAKKAGILQLHNDRAGKKLKTKMRRNFRSISDFLATPVAGPHMEPCITFKDPYILAETMGKPEVLGIFDPPTEGRRARGAPKKPEEEKKKSTQAFGWGMAEGLAKQLVERELVTFTTAAQFETMVVCLDALKVYFEAMSTRQLPAESVEVEITPMARKEGTETVRRTLSYSPIAVMRELFPDYGIEYMPTGTESDMDFKDMGAGVTHANAGTAIKGGKGMNKNKTLNPPGLDVGWVHYNLWSMLQRIILQNADIVAERKDYAARVYNRIRGWLLQKDGVPKADLENGFSALVYTLTRSNKYLGIGTRVTAPKQGEPAVLDIKTVVTARVEANQGADDPIINQVIAEGMLDEQGQQLPPTKSATWRDFADYLNKKDFNATEKLGIPQCPCKDAEEIGGIANFLRFSIMLMGTYTGTGGTLHRLISYALKGYDATSPKVVSELEVFKSVARASKRLARAQTCISSLAYMVGRVQELAYVVKGQPDLPVPVVTNIVDPCSGEARSIETIPRGEIVLWGAAAAEPPKQQQPQLAQSTSSYSMSNVYSGKLKKRKQIHGAVVEKKEEEAAAAKPVEPVPPVIPPPPPPAKQEQPQPLVEVLDASADIQTFDLSNASGVMDVVGEYGAFVTGQTDIGDDVLEQVFTPTQSRLVKLGPQPAPGVLLTQPVTPDEWTKKFAVTKSRLVGTTAAAFARCYKDFPEAIREQTRLILQKTGCVPSMVFLAHLQKVWTSLRQSVEAIPLLGVVQMEIAAGAALALTNAAVYFDHDAGYGERTGPSLHVSRRDETLGQLRDETARWLHDQADLVNTKRESEDALLTLVVLCRLEQMIKHMNTRITNIVPVSRKVGDVVAVLEKGMALDVKTPTLFVTSATGEQVGFYAAKNEPSQILVPGVLVNPETNSLTVHGTSCARVLRYPLSVGEALDHARYQRSAYGLADAVILWMAETVRGLRCRCAHLAICDSPSPAACLMENMCPDGLGDVASKKGIAYIAQQIYGEDVLTILHHLLRDIHSQELTLESGIECIRILVRGAWPKSALAPLFLPACSCQSTTCSAGPVNLEMKDMPPATVSVDVLSEDPPETKYKYRMAIVDGKPEALPVMDRDGEHVLPCRDRGSIALKSESAAPNGLVAVFANHSEDPRIHTENTCGVSTSDRLALAVRAMWAAHDPNIPTVDLYKKLLGMFGVVVIPAGDSYVAWIKEAEYSEAMGGIALKDGRFQWDPSLSKKLRVKAVAQYEKARENLKKTRLTEFPSVRVAEDVIMSEYTTDREESAKKASREALLVQSIAIAIEKLPWSVVESVIESACEARNIYAANGGGILEKLRAEQAGNEPPLFRKLPKVHKLLSPLGEYCLRTPVGALLLAANFAVTGPDSEMRSLKIDGSAFDVEVIRWVARKVGINKIEFTPDKLLALAVCAATAFASGVPEFTHTSFLMLLLKRVNWWRAKSFFADPITQEIRPYMTPLTELPDFAGSNIMLLGHGDTAKWLQAVASVGFTTPSEAERETLMGKIGKPLVKEPYTEDIRTPIPTTPGSPQ